MTANVEELIRRRRYQLLIHSCIYYELDQNVISDSKWNAWSEELVDLQNRYPELSNKIELAEYFKNWDGSTGAFLPLKEDWVIQKAQRVLYLSRKKFIKKKDEPVKKQEKSSSQLTLF